MKKGATEGGDKRVRWVGDGGDVSQGRRENLLLVRKQDGRDMGPSRRFVNAMLPASCLKMYSELTANSIEPSDQGCRPPSWSSATPKQQGSPPDADVSTQTNSS